MKKLLSIIIVVILSTTLLNAQDTDVNTFKGQFVKVGSGKGALTSGLDGTLFLINGDNQIEVTGNTTRIYAGYYWLNNWGKIGITGGVFKNTPWLGSLLTLKLTDNISTLHWIGGRVNPLEKPTEIDPGLFFNFHGIYYSPFKNFTVGYALMHFIKDKPLHLPGANYVLEISKEYSLKFSADYSVTKEDILYCIAVIKQL